MDLIKRGIIRPGKGRISQELLDKFPVIQVPLEDIVRIIAEEREDRV
jgi:hypothetical protein